MHDFSHLRVAIVHEWLTQYVGSEKVLEQFLTLFPQADLYTVADFLPESERAFLGGKRARTTFIQNLPGARFRYRSYLPLMPLAIEQFDLQGYDLVLSSSHAVAKGVLTGPDQIHVCYCHSPMRYAWDLQHQYLRQSGITPGFKSLAIRALLHYMRIWDARTANGVDQFIANSNYIARRIHKTYGRESVVIHPPVDTEFFTPAGQRESYFLAASRFVPYKRMELIVRAFSRRPDLQLVLAGDGPNLGHCRSIAGKNVKFLGHQPADALRQLLRQASAFVFAAEEDFGILPVEAQSCGTPVIAYGRGGVLDSVIPGKTGILFEHQTEQCLLDAVDSFDSKAFDPVLIRRHAERFGASRFRQAIADCVSAAFRAHGAIRVQTVL